MTGPGDLQGRAGEGWFFGAWVSRSLPAFLFPSSARLFVGAPSRSGTPALPSKASLLGGVGVEGGQKNSLRLKLGKGRLHSRREEFLVYKLFF